MYVTRAQTKAARELEITLTGKDCGQEERAPMAGVPHHAAEIYISKLIAKGYKVAICEQLEDPKTAKGYIGGMKEVPARVMLEKTPEKAMMLAVKGMLPHNSLGRAQLKKLRVYAGSEHENQAQKPEVWEVK